VRQWSAALAALALLLAASACGRGAHGRAASAALSARPVSFAATSPCRRVRPATLERLVGSRLAAGPVEQHDDGPLGPRRVCRYGFNEEIGFNVEVLDRPMTPDALAAAVAGSTVPVAGLGDRAWYSEEGMYLAVHTSPGAVVTVRAVMWSTNPKRSRVAGWLRTIAAEAVPTS
jgi:hypothetical protein